MPDRGRPIEFGVFLVPNADKCPELVALVERSERLGLEYVGIQDHPYQRRFLDTFALWDGTMPAGFGIGHPPGMYELISLLVRALHAALRSRTGLVTENLLLRHLLAASPTPAGNGPRSTPGTGSSGSWPGGTPGPGVDTWSWSGRRRSSAGIARLGSCSGRLGSCSGGGSPGPDSAARA